MPSSCAASCQRPGEPRRLVPEVADAAGLCAARAPLQCPCHHDIQQCVLLVRGRSEMFRPPGKFQVATGTDGGGAQG